MYTRETAGAKRASDGAALLDVLAQLDAVARVPELRERRALDGADLLLRLAADLADLAPRPRLAVVEAEAQAEHVALRGLEVRVHGVVDGVAELVERRRLLRRGLVALDDLVERRRLREIRDVGPLASPRRTEGHVQREGRQSRAARELQALLRRADARARVCGHPEHRSRSALTPANPRTRAAPWPSRRAAPRRAWARLPACAPRRA
mmetsp:Transcript_4109/g.12995  ORF Transcript_4109/g.12995 Transcript_4109/m.12995 type:complete len:208 (-) Transcript_4109:48-671(-)